MSDLTRTPVQATEPSRDTTETLPKPLEEQTVVVPEKSEKPPVVSTINNEKPYLTTLLEMGEAYGQFEMKSLSKEVDDYLNAELERTGKENTQDNYKELFDKVVDDSKARGLDIYTLVERVAEYSRIRMKLIELAKEKEAFEKMPLEDMTSSQLKRYIEK